MSLQAAILGAGFIGRNFIRHVLRQGYEVRVLDHNDPPDEFAGLTWIVGDLAREEDVVRVLQGVDTVFHFVSSTVPGDEIDESRELRQNVFLTLHLLRLCIRHGVRRVVFISSASVYGVQQRLPIAETASTDPISTHGIHKLAIEKYLLLYRRQHGIDCKIVRLSNPYGPGQPISGRQGFVGIAIGRLLAGTGIEVRGDGTVIRDFIYIDDVCQALHLVATRDTDQQIFNIGSGQGHELNEVIALLSDLAGTTIPVAYTPARFVDIPASILEISRARDILGFAPQVSLDEGLRRTLAFHGVKGRGRSVIE